MEKAWDRRQLIKYMENLRSFGPKRPASWVFSPKLLPGRCLYHCARGILEEMTAILAHALDRL